MKNPFTHKIALFTIAVGKDPVYFNSVRRYFPYNKENFGQGCDVDYYVFTDRAEIIEDVISIPCESYDFFSPDFMLVKPYWNEKNGDYTYDLGRLLKLDDAHYRILWSKQPERREILNMEILKIRKQPVGFDSAQTSPVISVVMPTYNTPQEYLRESVESILKQTFADFELLIIDDGSTETQGIEWLETLQDTRIRLIRNLHDFIDSLNRGVAESRGKYIARMDADDVAMPNRLQRQYDFMEEHPEIDVCGLCLIL